MTIAVNETYTEVILTSSLLESLSGNETLTIKGQVACEGISSYELDPVNITDGAFTVDLGELFGGVLDDGVYSFTVRVEQPDNSAKEDYACLFVDKTIKCQVAECVKDAPNFALQLDYWILSRSWNCECNCENTCAIWKRVKHELERCQGC